MRGGSTPLDDLSGTYLDGLSERPVHETSKSLRSATEIPALLTYHLS